MEENTTNPTADEIGKKKFHVLVTNTETGETLVDHETVCVIMSYECGDSVKSASLSSCSVLNVAQVIVALESAIASTEKNENVCAAVSFLKLSAKCAGRSRRC